jgi:murein DD-endopeptidase MepM/ murein hydrolase activator NlpD
MIRPVDTPVGQGFGENPTSALPAGHWVLKQFGNYQPDGHAGEDYPCPVGTPIRAVTSGRVLHVGFYGGTYRDNPYWIAPNFAGYCYVIDHGSFVGIYAHGMDRGARVKVGESVAEGRSLGFPATLADRPARTPLRDPA